MTSTDTSRALQEAQLAAVKLKNAYSEFSVAVGMLEEGESLEVAAMIGIYCPSQDIWLSGASGSQMVCESLLFRTGIAMSQRTNESHGSLADVLGKIIKKRKEKNEDR